MSNNTKTVEAIILSRKNIGEADRLLTAFTLELGKIKIIAKGARKIKSKMACHIEPFMIGRYQLIKGKSFYILTGAEKIINCDPPAQCLDSFKHISYLCEIVDLSMQEEEPEKNIYALLKRIALLPKDTISEKYNTILRYFEFCLLKALGYDPNYKKCVKCSATVIEKNIFNGNFEGIVCCEDSKKLQSIDKNTLKILRLFNERSLEEIININGLERHSDNLEVILTSYLFDILPRKPKSQEL